ncbi:MAG: hypothetical protein Q9171_005986 [Xanthocarpia ochracea]
MHGDIEALETANGVRKSDVWFLLNDFSLVLATIQTSLANFMKIPEAGAAGGADMQDLVGGGDEGNNRDDEAVMAERDSGYGSAASSVVDDGSATIASTTGSQSGAGKPKKKKVQDSWEVEADADAQAEEEEEAWDDGDSEEDEGPQTVAEMEKGFLKIYKAVSKLKKEFDEKFKAMFA